MVEKSSGADYEAAKTSPIMNDPVGGAAVYAAMGADGEWSLLADNRKRFPQVFGKMSTRWVGWVRYDVWKVKVAEDAHLFFMASRRGTHIELSGNKDKMPEAADFILKKLVPELKVWNEDGTRKGAVGLPGKSAGGAKASGRLREK